MDRLRAIKYFIEVAERKSFRGAAKSFSVPASSVSRRIQELEATLGAALVHRTTRVVRLTELGRVYLDHVRSAVAALDYADELVSANPNQPSGTLRITASPDYGRICVVPVLTKLKRAFPDIVLDIELTDQVSNLASNDVDLAIRATAEPPARSVARKLSDNRFFLVASPQYIDSYGCPSNLAELATHRTLIYRRPDGLLHWQAKTDVGWRELRTVHAYISNQGDALVENALAGTGIALIPQWGVEKYISEGSLVNIALCDAEISISRNPNSGLYLLYQQPKYALQKVKVAVDFLISELSPNSD
jgi:DNA-binding transcriptional LysR family regulator